MKTRGASLLKALKRRRFNVKPPTSSTSSNASNTDSARRHPGNA